MSPELLDGQPPPSDPGDLVNYTLLHVIGYEEGWGHWLNQLGYYHVDASQGIHFDSLITGMEMAAQGHGVALSRSSLVADYLERGRLVAPFNVTVPTSEAFYVTTSTVKPVQPHAQAFQQWIVEQAEAGTMWQTTDDT